MEQDLQQGFARITKEISDVGIKVNGVLSLLKGNELNKGDQGMLGKLAELESKVDRLEKFKDKALWIGVGMGIPAGFGFLEIFRKILFHT